MGNSMVRSMCTCKALCNGLFTYGSCCGRRQGTGAHGPMMDTLYVSIKMCRHTDQVLEDGPAMASCQRCPAILVQGAHCLGHKHNPKPSMLPLYRPAQGVNVPNTQPSHAHKYVVLACCTCSLQQAQTGVTTEPCTNILPCLLQH